MRELAGSISEFPAETVSRMTSWHRSRTNWRLAPCARIEAYRLVSTRRLDSRRVHSTHGESRGFVSRAPKEQLLSETLSGTRTV